MIQSPLTVVALSRSTRIVGAVCIVLSLLAGGMTVLSDPNFSANSFSGWVSLLGSDLLLYFFPGLILIVLGAAIKSGRLWAAPLILVISIMSLFKLVLLLTPLTGPIFRAPPYCEIPARILCAMLSVPCVFAWEDLAEINRTRARRSRAHSLSTPPQDMGLPRIPRRMPPPPPPSKRLRPKIRPEDPPTSQTPWS